MRADLGGLLGKAYESAKFEVLHGRQLPALLIRFPNDTLRYLLHFLPDDVYNTRVGEYTGTADSVQISGVAFPSTRIMADLPFEGS
jgi:hypothetical protein